MIAKGVGIGVSAGLLACLAATPMQAKADDSKFDSPIIRSSLRTPIAGVPSGGAPWVVSRGHTRLESSGELRVEVTGLLLGAAAGANAGTTAGIPQIAASVVCGDVVVATTDPVLYPATGSFEIRDMLTLTPPGCPGAVVLIRIVRPANTPAGPYIAVSGVLN
jgi:hypothetical protein